MEFISKQISNSHHIEFYLNWATVLLTAHASKENVFKQQTLISIQDSLTRKYESLSKICDFNKYTLKILSEMGESSAQINAQTDDDENDSDDSDASVSNLLMNNGKHSNNDEDIDMASDDSGSDSS